MSKLLVLIPLFVPILALSIVLIWLPQEIVRLQGKFYRFIYRRWMRKRDEQIDAPFMLPLDRRLMGERSDFIKNAPENPNRYHSLIALYRIFGAVILLLVVCVCGVALLAVAVGAMR